MAKSTRKAKETATAAAAPEVAAQPAANTQLEVRRESGMTFNTISVDEIGKLQEAKAAPIDLMSDYWSPEIPGEFKRVLFDRFDVSLVLAQDTNEVIELECAFFFTQGEDGAAKSIRNGSKRLVGALQAYNLQRGTPLEIRYMGKKQNRMNQFKSDNWSIKPLVINLPTK